MLGFPKDLEDIVYDSEKGILKSMKPNSYLIDHTTSSPGLAERIAADFKPLGV
jgi:3-hydroxyisobutyrate dehydrogenase-like beta-hydroxyacid dehydrogenase